MFSGFPLFPPQASTFAARVDALYFFLIAISAFFSTLIATLLVVFAVRYRRRRAGELPRPIHGSSLRRRSSSPAMPTRSTRRASRGRSPTALPARGLRASTAAGTG